MHQMNQPKKMTQILTDLLLGYAKDFFIRAVETEIKERPQVADPKTGKIYNVKRESTEDGEVLCGRCFHPLKKHKNGRCPS